MGHVKYVFVGFLKFMGNMFVIMLPIMVANFISTIMNIQDVGWSILIMFIGYIVLFIVCHFIDAFKYMKINNVSPKVAWEKTGLSESGNEFDF